jgi:hypothetical protein
LPSFTFIISIFSVQYLKLYVCKNKIALVTGQLLKHPKPPMSPKSIVL